MLILLNLTLLKSRHYTLHYKGLLVSETFYYFVVGKRNIAITFLAKDFGVTSHSSDVALLSVW